MWVLYWKLFGTLEVSSTDLIPAGFCSQKLWGLSSWHWNPGLGILVCVWEPSLCDIPPEFLCTTHGYETSQAHVAASPTSLDGCDFFNSVVVRLPFNLISNGSEWWLIYILFVPWLEIKPATLAYQDDTPTNSATWQEPTFYFYLFFHKEDPFYF